MITHVGEFLKLYGVNNKCKMFQGFAGGDMNKSWDICAAIKIEKHPSW